MSWKTTNCALCGQNCGLEVQVEDNRIIKTRPDKNNPKSEGYACRKGLNIAFHQHNADRVLYPMKRVGDQFERISWDQAVSEISEKLKGILDQHGPRSLAWIVSGQGCHLAIPYVGKFGELLGSQYNYTALGQEHTGRYWAHGVTLGSQGLMFGVDYKNNDMLVVAGWNPMMSHQTPQARKKIKKFAKDPDKLLVVIDPRVSETAKVADIHLAIRPGTDALLFKAMIAIILREGWYDKEYVEKHVNGLKEIMPQYADFDIKAALKVCELDYDQVVNVCREFSTRNSGLHDDLGVLMGRHSTLQSYLIVVLMAICGRICTPGGDYFPGSMIGGRTHSDPEDPNTWRTVMTDIPAIQGQFPPNVMPEEIMNDSPDRLRAVFTYGANPLRSYADTTAYEDSFKKLDLLVTADMVMSETAALAHYVLPSKSAYESWDATFFSMNFPEVYFQLRRPVVEPEGEQLESGEIYTRLADAMGLIPELPESLYNAAESGSGKEFRDALMGYVMENPESMGAIPFIVSKTLGNAIGSAHTAALSAVLQVRSETQMKEAEKAGFALGPDQGLEMFQAIMDKPEGLLVGVVDPDSNISELATASGKIELFDENFGEWLAEIDPEKEMELLEKDKKEYPFIMSAGRHMDYNANTNMRDPAWNKGKRACTAIMHPGDAEEHGFSDGQMVKVITEAGEETIELEVTQMTREGYIMIPHGFGLNYDGVKYGANVNRLTKNTHRDKIAGTPLHRYVPCRVERVTLNK
jgi:anaerobic selenocysteine-containing dehydrogenase